MKISHYNTVIVPIISVFCDNVVQTTESVNAYISYVSPEGHLFIHIQGPGLQKLEEVMDLIRQRFVVEVSHDKE